MADSAESIARPVAGDREKGLLVIVDSDPAPRKFIRLDTCLNVIAGDKKIRHIPWSMTT